ncbi:MAG: hypothetical protein ACRC35_01690 [Angustibacter sp.]
MRSWTGLSPRLNARSWSAVGRIRSVARRTASGSPDGGDVPGWVLVTLMTAGLVAGLWAVAGDLLNDLFRDAVTGVSGP